MAPMQRENERTVRAGYDAFNRRDWDAVVDGLAGAFEMVNVPTAECFAGREGLRRYFQVWAAAFPDLRVEIVGLHAEECRVAVETVARGTHTGPLVTPGGEISPTGRTVTLHGLDLWDLRAGKPARARTYYDTASMMRQLGLEPELDGPGAPLALDLTGVRIGGPAEVHRAVARRWFAALSLGTLEVLDELCAPGCRFHGAEWGAEDETGPEAARARAEAQRAAFPGLVFAVHDVLADNGRVAVRWTAEGTHAASGSRARWSGTTLWRMEGGRVAEDWTVSEAASTPERLDAVPVPASASEG